jgi:hypothetical protein
MAGLSIACVTIEPFVINSSFDGFMAGVLPVNGRGGKWICACFKMGAYASWRQL